ncbi:amino acid permease-domain-containing protein [Aspergillus filifer]
MSTTIDSKTPKTADLIEELRHDFKPRHVSMFSIAFAIGTGVLIGSGSALTKGGPGSLLVSYASVGVTVFFVMTSLGEMAAYVPMNKGFGGYATRMVDPAFGFSAGWNYFMKYLIATPTNLTAAGLIAVFGTAIIIINLLPVSNFGEMEFWLGAIKVLVMSIVILVCLIIALGGAPNHHHSGLNTGITLWVCMCQACFAYAGTEVVGMTFGEIPNPRKKIPRAVEQTFWRIASFYVIGILVLGMAVPSNDDRLLGANKLSTSAAASPFVVAINIAGISVLPDIINASLLVFTLSASSSGLIHPLLPANLLSNLLLNLYCASRALYGLAKDGQAPRIFSRISKSCTPVLAVGVSALFVALAFMNANKSAATVFNYFPFGAYYALFISVKIIARFADIYTGYDAFVPGFTISTLILKYLGTVLLIVNVAWWKVYQTTSYLKANEVDLVTGQQGLED